MKTMPYLILFFLISSCATSQRLTVVNYQRKSTGETDVPNSTYYLTLPKGFKLQTLVGGENELEKQYVYSDSSKIYVTDFVVSLLNYNNIRSMGDSTANKRFESISLKSEIAKELGKKYVPEPLTLQGKMANGLYWKDIRMGYISIGYVNVPENKKLQFDKVLASFRSTSR